MPAIDLDKIRVEPTAADTELASLELDDLYAVATRFVAFLDVLGFKSMVDRMSPEGLHRRYLNVIEKTPTDLFPTNCKVSSYVFSDSIILYTDDESLESAEQITTYAMFLLGNAASCLTLIKGAIAHGEFTSDKTNNIYFGVPLIDAYQLEEEMKVGSVILHDTCERKFIELNSSELNDKLVLVETPMKGYKVKHKHLLWHSIFKNAEEFYNLFYPQASGGARVYVENTGKLIEEIMRKADQ